MLELAPHFYVDKRKQMIEDHHRKEAIRNIEHDMSRSIPSEEGFGILGQIAKQNSRFKKGMNFGVHSSSILEKAVEIT